MNFIGLDIHKKTISYCVKDISGKVLSEGKIPATRQWPAGVGWGAGEALDGGDGSGHVYGLDLRLPSTARGSGEGGSSADAACHCRGEEEERSHRCRQDRRLPAL